MLSFKQAGNQVLKGFNDSTFYTNQFLKPEGTAQDFFDAISYPVDLQGLYKIKKTCYYHQAFEFAPILVEIIDQALQDHYDASYLLQIWSTKSEKVFEKSLKYDLKSWVVYSDHFIYKMDAREEGSEFIHIVNLRKKNAVIRIKDFLIDDPTFVHLGIIKDLFFYANSNIIKIVDVRQELEDGATIDIDVVETPALLCTYQLGQQCKLHGFYENQYCKSGEERGHYLICLIETEDNQIDFARLYFWSRDITKKDIQFYQYTEVVGRDVKFDPIQKFVFIAHSTQFLFGAAIRNSGKVDIYWNCKVVQSTEEEFIDVSINFQFIYLKRKDGSVLTIDTKHDIRVGVDVAEEKTITENEWNDIFYGTIKGCCRFFTSYVLINTSFFVAHQNIVSLFDIIKKVYIKHFFIDKKVLKVFRNEKTDTDYNLGIYVEGGGIQLIDSENTSDPSKWEKIANTYVTTGDIKQIVSDQEDYRMLYIITNHEGKPNLYGFSRKTLYIYNTLVHELKDTTIVVPFFAPAERTQFILFNKAEGEVRVYTHYWQNNAEGALTFYLTKIGEVIKIKTPALITGTVHTALTPDVSLHLFLVDEKNLYKIDVKTGETWTYKDLNIQSVQFLDNKYIYVLANSSAKRDLGFYLHDIQTFIEKDNDNNYRLDKSIVGVNSILDFSKDNQRLTYMIDYNTIQIVPTQHRNVINFIGMLNRDQYIASKKIKDKFMALDKKNMITTWNVMTGKLEGQYQLEGIDLSEYDIYCYEEIDITYKREWYQPKCLLMKRVPEVGWDDKKFYDPEMLKTSLENNTPYISIEQKKFHMFKLIEILNQSEIKEHFSFIHPFYGKGKYQRLYISENMENILERLVNQRVLLYQRVKDSQKLTMIKRLNRFPMDMSENTYANYLFSPDLMFYLDYDKQINKFVIKETLSQKNVHSIPTGLMNAEDEEVKVIAKRFKWLDSDRIKLVNKEGIEKIIDLKDNFKEISYGSIGDFTSTFTEKVRHFYFHLPSLKLGDTFERLQRKQQAFKSAYYLLGMRETFQLYDVLFDIDYSLQESKYKFVADLSFTLLHWKLLENLKKEGDSFEITSIDQNQLKQLAYNIFPNCDTFLHNISSKQNLIKDLYKIAEGKFTVPFIQNVEGFSPLQMCMKNNEFKNADIFLQKLANAPLDHHGRCVASSIPLAIQQGLPSVAKYLDSRFIQTEQIKQLRRGCLNTHGDLDYSFTTGHFWDNLKDVENRLFVVSPVDSDIKIDYLDVPYLHCFENQGSKDLFEELSNVGVDQIELFETKAIQLLIEYQWPLVREFTIKKLMLPFIFYWFTFFIFSNFVFEGSVITTYDADTNEITSPIHSHTSTRWGSYICALFLLPSSIYVFYLEIRQVLIVGPVYFLAIWNYLDFIPPILILVIMAFDLLDLSPDFGFLRTCVAVTSFLLWLKFLYFLRIFKSTGYLIRMIQQVIIDMRVFLFVLALVVLAFSDAFIALSRGLPAGEAFAGDNFLESFLWTYRLSLGDFQLDDVNTTQQPLSAWIFFFGCSILNVIVMLNLLIAIISESFGVINGQASQASNQERARIIAENSYLIPDSRKKEFSNEAQYLLVARVEMEDQEGDSVISDIKGLRTEFSSSIHRVESKIDAILTNLKIKA